MEGQETADEMASFLDEFGSSSDDGELPQPEPSAKLPPPPPPRFVPASWSAHYAWGALEACLRRPPASTTVGQYRRLRKPASGYQSANQQAVTAAPRAQSGAVLDADDLLEAREAAVNASMIAAGTRTAAEVEELKAKRRYREEVHVCRHMVQSRLWETDATASRLDVLLCYAAALAGLNRRAEAITLLELAIEQGGAAGAPACEQLSLSLTLAKLLFKEDRKQEALARCVAVYSAHSSGEAEAVSDEDVADAYHLAGWIKIHGDDHSGTYRTWSAGHLALPKCALPVNTPSMLAVYP